MDELKIYINYIAKVFESIGVITIVIGTLMALFKYVFAIQKVKPRSYRIVREELGKALLLGLEILVAGDIIATVATEPEMQQVLALALIVVIRILLSFSTEIEIEGKLPWRKAESEQRDR